MAKFEKVSRFADIDFDMPARKTMYSAGYDFVVAEDVIIEPYDTLMNDLFWEYGDGGSGGVAEVEPINLDEMAALTKRAQAKPTLVSTGVKCQLAEDQYLQLSVRSSCPLKNWLIMANGVGIIDSDYYNNPDNEGEIFFQIINLSPLPIYLKRGDRIGQGIIMKYDRTENDVAVDQRTGGFGSTNA